ncbi:MAG: dihydroorotate dehydrogenase electron transfer subunit [Pseudomonadota bacterium]|nr:dihydroorotate dehydrogenase electron transfer subunit [Pseudomonadota bacterium]
MSTKNGSIFLENAEVIKHSRFDGNQFILRLIAPKCSKKATPGSFAHIQCSPDISMRRPLSIMRANASEGYIEFLYKPIGAGLEALSLIQPGDKISLLGPIGKGFKTYEEKPLKLMLGGGVGIPPINFLAENLKKLNFDVKKMLVLMGSEVPFPFETQNSLIKVQGLDTKNCKSISSLEKLGIASRLSSLQGYPGCYQGYITDLATTWIASLSEKEKSKVEVFACGPEKMLHAAAKLAKEYNLPCQLCLEEFMACAVGGCAGCTVNVRLEEGVTMKRVCVDGPVFQAKSIYPS